MSWRYFATRLHGDGTEETLDPDLPLTDVALTDALSGPGGLSASISPEVARLRARGLFTPWSTALYAEADGIIRGGGILVDKGASGPSLTLDCAGFTAYAAGMPYTGERRFIKADPLGVVRHAWAHLQGQPHGNIGLEVAGTSSPVRIGTEPRDVSFTTGSGESVDFEAGPFVLAWYQTEDLGSVIDELAESTPFDYHERHEWDGEVIRHRLDLGYPRIGARRHNLRFVVGENVDAVPALEYEGDEYADSVLCLGSGEGRAMKRGLAPRRSDETRLRRVAVVADKAATSKARALSRALAEQSRRLGLADVSELTVRQHPHARLGSFAVGDDIRLDVPAGWEPETSLWLRILAITTSPDDSNSATLTVQRAEKD